MNISATIRGIGLPRTIVIAGLTAVIAAFGIIGCASSGPPQISEQNRELCFQHEAGYGYDVYAIRSREAADTAEQLANSGDLIAAGYAAAAARQEADRVANSVDNITDNYRRGHLDADDLRRSARACRDIAQDYARYAEQVAQQ